MLLSVDSYLANFEATVLKNALCWFSCLLWDELFTESSDIRLVARGVAICSRKKQT